MNTPKALMELAQKPPLEIAETVVKGFYELGKETVKSGKDVALGDASTDLVLNTADVVTTFAGGAGAVKSLTNVGTAARVVKATGEAAFDSAKATLKEMPAVIKEAAAAAPKTAPVLALEGGMMAMDLIPDIGKGPRVLMAVANKTTEGVKGAVSAGAKAGSRTRKIAAMVRHLEEGTSTLAENYRAFKAGEALPTKKPTTMAEAVKRRKAGGTLEKPHDPRLHHDMPKTLKPLWEAFDIDYHQTVRVDLVEHQIIHGTGGFFHDSNVLWAHKLSQVDDLWKLNAKMLDQMRTKINATFGEIPSLGGKTLNDVARVPYPRK
nr:uncharacterized protein CTRU02_01109 [Colletotrichum truncatum]KAF6800704.1 hypothetical protein CTRU02_01109 [Colletotrichum truncatum]